MGSFWWVIVNPDSTVMAGTVTGLILTFYTFHRWMFESCVGKIMMLTPGSSQQLSLAASLCT